MENHTRVIILIVVTKLKDYSRSKAVTNAKQYTVSQKSSYL